VQRHDPEGRPVMGRASSNESNDLRDRRIETTQGNLEDARRAGDQEWVDAEEAILRSLRKGGR
jgi:hypothetical protein